MNPATAALIETLIADLAAWDPADPDDPAGRWEDRFPLVRPGSAGDEAVRQALAGDTVAPHPLWFRIRPAGRDRRAAAVGDDGRVQLQAPYRYRRTDAQDLVALLAVGPVDDPDALVVHWSGFEGADACLASTDAAIVLPGNPWADTDRPGLVPLWFLDDIDSFTRAGGAPQLNVEARERALGSLFDAADISVRVDYRALGFVCPDCWDAPAYSRLTHHPQRHHDGLDMCVDAGVFPVIDAALACGWETQFSCQGDDDESGGGRGYVVLIGTMPEAVRDALTAAGCVVEQEPSRVTVRWPAGEPERAAGALTAGPEAWARAPRSGVRRH